MKEIKELLIDTLQQTFNFPVYQLGKIEPDDDLPADYFTFRIDGGDDVNFDNTDAATAWDININYFSINPENVATIPQQARAALKAAGFIPQGRGYDLISDTPNYSGWYSDYYYLQINNKGV